ncbi:FAD-dependent oxidoreductase [Zavarzinia sp. CC-PAN008]|uniref:FAD-dependent oxidoreductase n=1 Tax=Zavarzinia sp. CC-PAN008 TaxID=3243332 RepID=UPI003F746EAD
MSASYEAPRYPYRRSVDQDRPGRHAVVVVGAGMVGLAMAVDLALRGVACVVLDDNDTVSTGSRSICHAQRTLEIYDRLGIAERVRGRGVVWNRGRVFRGDREIYDFNLQPEGGQAWPAFINLQQFHVEEWLVERALATGLVDLRWRNRVTGVAPQADGVALDIDTPDGAYRLQADWVIACDGANSTVRQALGLDFAGRVFQDRFLIADVKMEAEFPTERWFWFDPPFNPGQSALLHRQADNVWRIDLQLGPDADPEQERQPERVIPRLKAMLGAEARFTLDWVSVYTFCCRRLERFRHGRVLFAGDAAHQVSPFGARGGNGGIQDVDNLAWKLALVLAGHAPETLLDTYDAERGPAADENILNSTRATDFLTPKSGAGRALRDAVLDLAERFAFARPMVNSGRLSRPHTSRSGPLNSPDAGPFDAGAPAGAPLPDAPFGAGWLLPHLGDGFTLLWFGRDLPAAPRLGEGPVPIRLLVVPPEEGLAWQRCGAEPGTCLLVRPDQHIAARFRSLEVEAVLAARDRALGLAPQAIGVAA